MADPTTKTELLALMRDAHQEVYDTLARIPESRMDEIALYGTWTVKDLIAHLGWWMNSAAERIAIVQRGETPQRFPDFDEINAEVLERYRHTPLNEVRSMEEAGFAALETLVDSAESDAVLFDPKYYPQRNGHAIVGTIDGNTYGHFAEHLPDLQAWMQQNDIG